MNTITITKPICDEQAIKDAVDKLVKDLLDNPIPIGWLNGKPIFSIGKESSDKDFTINTELCN